MRTLLNVSQVHGQEVYAIALKLGCVVSVRYQIEIHDILGYHELTEDVLAQICQSPNHEIVSIDEEAEEESQVALSLTETICVEELDNGSEVLFGYATHKDIFHSIMLNLIHQEEILMATLRKAIPRAKHNAEVLTTGMEHSTVCPHQVLAI